ncbi:Protein virilizer [Ooceraea biroi]|uniref:Protein virilizer n=1 Tax=Ooceraea biroi TaxID=2015173 RepID=A0A026WFD9_OOCBI|nr:Protein virilizer [Ooceraea biroi]
MDNIELLFFDTFSHDISEELNLDLVQFPKPVYISEVRIIPLGARVQADFPGGVRLGATNPSQFEIEFFVNDLSKPGASTFEFLGGLEYKQNIHIQLECERKQIPTDGLVLRGWYTTITLAVYGTLTKSLNNPQEVISSAAGSTTCVNVLEENSESTAQISSEQQSEWYYENQHQTNSSETCVTVTPPPPVQPIQVVEPTRTSTSDTGKTESGQWEEEASATGEKPAKRPSSPPTESLISLSPESISAEEEEAEQQETGEPETGEPFEPILSDEDIMTDDIPSTTEFESESSQTDEIYALVPPDLLNLEKLENLDNTQMSHESLLKMREILQSLSKSVSHFHNASGQEKETFVHNCETLCAILGPFDSNADDIDLTNIVNAGLDMELARAQPQPAYKMRHVKVGVRLAEALCRLSKGPEILLKVEAPSKLLSLCMRENVALPVKLSALRALDAALISPIIVQEFLSSRNNLYNNALMMLDTTLARLKYALSSILRKIHVYEYLEEIREFDEIGLAELMNTYVCAPTLMAQPKRQLPAGAQMEFEREHSRNPRAHFVAYFEYHKLARHLLLTLSSPNCSFKLNKLIRHFLLHLSDTKEGLCYLLKEAEVVRLTLKVLKYELPGAGFPDGLRALLTVLPLGDFMDTLIPYLSDSNLCEFAAEVISAVVRYSDKVEILQNHAELMLSKSREHAVLRDVTSYLTTAAQASHWDYNDVSSLVTTIRKSAEKAASLPGQLITACRILHYLIFLSNNDVDPLEPYIELKYRNALTQLFAADGLTALVSVMANVSEFYEQPFLHRAALTGRRGMALVALLLPCVRLTRALLEQLVKCMATDFKDLTVVVPLLGIYSLIEAIPSDNLMVRTLSEEIVGTLLVFTQAVDSDGSGNVAKSLWTQMLGEVLKMVSLRPCNFVPGLKLLTRLLPPVLTPKETATEDATRILGLRKLWSAHLQAQAGNLTETLRLLCASWNAEVLLLLSTVCKQLSDLAAPTALLVGRCLLDGILAATPLENNVPILVLISDLARHAPMKATLLTLTSPASRAQVKSDQKYPPVIEMMCSTLKSSGNVRVQYEILNIFETLCDCSLSLVQEDNESFEKKLTHSVPSKEPLLSILAALIEILATSTKFQLDVIESTLHILLSLSNHNYGLYHVKSCLENNPGALRALLDHVSSLEEPETNSVARLTITFLENLIASESERSLHLRTQQLAFLISWEKNNHPLEKLKSAEELVETLRTAEEKEEKEPIPEMLEPLLPTPEALLSQFSQRCSGAVSSSPARSKKFSFATTNQTQAENTVDLLALAAELLPADFNLLAEAQNLCSKTPPDDATQPLQSKSQNEDQENRSEKQASPMVKTKQPFVTPVRGRTQFANSLRGGPVGGGVGRGADPFRSRPPNTSRPPSLHVDEFVALETCGAQPTGPTGYNKLSNRGTCSSRASSGARSRPWTQEPRPPYHR